MIPDEKMIKELQEILELKYGKKLTCEECRGAAFNLLNYYEALYTMAKKEYSRKQRLIHEPKGFHLMDGTYSCCICGINITGDQSWYDKYGNKCLFCQKAVDKRIIPVSACKNRDSWYSKWELNQYYGIKELSIPKLLNLRKLKARVILDETNKPYFYVFLVKENAVFPKSKPEYRFTQTGESSFRVESPELQKLPI